jgi:hypothetical protein
MQDTKEPFLVYLIEGIFLIFLIVVIGGVAYHLISESTPTKPKKPKNIAEFVEAQELEIKRKPDSVKVYTQKTDSFKHGAWSSNDHLFVYNVSAKDSLAFSLPIPEESDYRIIVHLSKSYDYGKWDIRVNEMQAGKADLYSTRIESAEPIDLGTHRLTPSNNVLVFEATGHNARARPPYYQLGIDGVVIKRVNETP